MLSIRCFANLCLKFYLGEAGGLLTDSQLWKEHWGEAKVEEREAVRKVGLEPRLSRSREENTDSYREPEMGSRDLQRHTLAQYSVRESHYYGSG